MPDWSYQTVFRPLLFCLAPLAARDLTLAAMGTLARVPGGALLIGFLGHMQPDPRLSCRLGHVEFPSPVGLGACVDPQLRATRALSRFGFGFIEVGPISLLPVAAGRVDRDTSAESLVFHDLAENPGLDAVVERLNGVPRPPLFVRLDDPRDGSDFSDAAAVIIQRLGKRAAGFILRIANLADSACLLHLSALAKGQGPKLILLRLATGVADSDIHELVPLIERGIIDGVVVDGALHDEPSCARQGRAAFPATLQTVSRLRLLLPSQAHVIASGGVHEPLQALQLLEAGSDLVGIDTGLIFSGPGLAKRINEAVLFYRADGEPVEKPGRPAATSWFWTCLMAVGMLIGGILALVIAHTRVVMPYDEATCGLTRSQIAAINDRLLLFMQHDRATLVGTMLSVGILYFALSVWGSRRGMHWAHCAIVSSALAGFVSFFLFLGFGYFDPFHAFVTAILFQMLALAVHSDLPHYHNPVAPDLTNDRAWRLSQWGQLLFIMHGVVLLVAGCVISAVGISSVFVAEDLEFMRASAEQLFGSHPYLVPLLAHDRATFGGMLIACGVCVLLSSLWGFRRGHAWLWWALMTAGCTAYAATILVHWQVGYTSLLHLLPAYGGLGLMLLSGGLAHSHLCGRYNSVSKFDLRRSIE